MRPALGLLLLLAAVAPASGAEPGLVVDARLVPGALQVQVANRHPAAVAGLAPEVVYQHRTLTAPPVDLEPGGRHVWEIRLPPPLRPGAAAAVVRVRPERSDGAPAAPVVVALVATSGTAPADVRVRLDAAAVGRSGQAVVRLANPGADAVDGRVVLVLPDGLATDPQTRPARVPGRGDAEVPFVVENRGGLPPGPYASYALFEYADDDGQQTAVAKAVVPVEAVRTSESVPLVVGAAALLAAIAALGVALRRSRPAAGAAALVLAGALAGGAAAADGPIRLAYEEGDIAGVTGIADPANGQSLGVVEYRQTRRGDVLVARRVARFADGSSDEDVAEARVAGTLEALRGRSVIRDAAGATVAEVDIDVAGGRLRGRWGDGATLDEAVALPPRTYWGPLIFFVLKNFEHNAEAGRLPFRTVALTPRPRVFDLELVRGDAASVARGGARLETTAFELAPTLHWLVDPIIRRFVPTSSFFVQAGDPPALVRFEGPRNYARRKVRIE